MPLEEVEVTQLRPDRFAEVLTSDALAAFERSMARGRELLGSRAIWNVNSTAFGGGVAEMLRSLHRLRARRGRRWALAGASTGDPVLPPHQAPAQPAARGARRRRAARRGGRATCTSAGARANAAALLALLRPGDVVILHDPQTAGMLPALRAAATAR